MKNMIFLGSLMEAKKFLEKDTLVLYSDIIFELKIIEKNFEIKRRYFYCSRYELGKKL